MGNSGQTTVTTPLTLSDGRVCPVADPWEVQRSFCRLTVDGRMLRVVAIHKDALRNLGLERVWTLRHTTHACPYLVTVIAKHGAVYYRVAVAAANSEDAARSFGLRHAIAHATGIAL